MKGIASTVIDRALRAIDRALAAGQRVPSSEVLARDLGVALSTASYARSVVLEGKALAASLAPPALTLETACVCGHELQDHVRGAGRCTEDHPRRAGHACTCDGFTRPVGRVSFDRRIVSHPNHGVRAIDPQRDGAHAVYAGEAE